ncbi:DUF2508 family protein [Convivina praedatoris]|uniref:Uncharacterized protein n=1 Tax=Convivina praedatoris TaxID=2880963 RepID=A0ABM9D0G0_9LACO|nr:DUF2508 family protein [Convivina sp. LMG 32447]CAH1851648.1 hypothetical protein LMG032447_00369 [Convivina sp. LMG 32447]CAH1851671.1 hypothetical protein R078138_00379 [Convivina sp. LMG 32447]CAH1853166.1 hypothetical protein R077815_00738 [Convivina sp. LMG 32447]
MFKKNKKIDIKNEYDQILLYQVRYLKRSLLLAQESETALVDSRVNGHLIEAQTALKRAKFNYVYREARHRQTVEDMQNMWFQGE